MPFPVPGDVTHALHSGWGELKNYLNPKTKIMKIITLSGDTRSRTAPDRRFPKTKELIITVGHP